MNFVVSQTLYYHHMLCRGNNGELRVGVRRLARQQSSMPSSVISSQSMHLGVLATAAHAVKTSTLFIVYYKPRFLVHTCVGTFYFDHPVSRILDCLFLYSSIRTSQFIIGLNKYLEAVHYCFSVGMRFKMRFEVEDSPERRYFSCLYFPVVRCSNFVELADSYG